jgi:CheY-like chemotaxis protein
MVCAGEERSIVVGDDDPDTVDVLKEILQIEDFAVDAYLSGSEALKRLREAPLPCLLLVDLLMPDMDGMEFIRAARREGHKAPAVLVTACPADAKLLTPEELVRLNVVRVLLKPLEYDAFLSMVEAFSKLVDTRAAPCP